MGNQAVGGCWGGLCQLTPFAHFDAALGLAAWQGPSHDWQLPWPYSSSFCACKCQLQLRSSTDIHASCTCMLQPQPICHATLEPRLPG